MINFRSLILFSVCIAITLFRITNTNVGASSLPVSHYVFAENNRTKFVQQFLTSSSSDFNDEITFVALTNQGCGNCAFLYPIWNQVVSNFSQKPASTNAKKKLFKYTKTNFVWVECATAPSVCENSELFAQVAKYPYIAAFAVFASPDHCNKTFIRLDGADGDGLKPMTDKTTGKSIGNLDSNNNQHQQNDDQSEPDSDQEQMWSVERLRHLVHHIVNPFWNNENNNNIKSASDMSRFVLPPFDISTNKPFLREPSSIFVVYFPRVDPKDNQTIIGRRNNQNQNSNHHRHPLHSCTKISSDQQKLNQKAKGNVLRAASYLSLSSLEVESQYKFLWLEDDDDQQQKTSAEEVLVDLMTNSDTDGSKSNFYEVVTTTLDDDNNEIVAEQQMASKYPHDFNDEQKILRQLEADFLASLEGADEKENQKFMDPETGKIINAEKHLKYQEAKTQLANHKAKLESLEKSFTSSIIDSDNTNGVVSSFVAEFLNDRKNLHEDHCQFLSRPVIGILRCVEFVPVESAFNVSIRGATSSINGRFCKQFSATWNWVPGTHNTSLSSAFYNHHQKENDKNKKNKNNGNRRDDLFVLSLVSPSLTPASILPRVTVVTDSAGERMFPGKIIDAFEPLSRAATRPFAFAKEEFHGTKHSQEISDQHHHHHHRHLFDDKNNKLLNFDDYEIESHTQPIFAFFTETQTCQGRPSSYWSLVESVEKLASEYLNTTFVIFDGFKYSEYYLRAGLTRPVVDKMRLGMVIMDKGRKFSVIDALSKRNTTDDQNSVAYATGVNRIQKNFPTLAFSEDAARLFLEYFWSGDKIRPYGKVVKITNQDDEIVRHLGQWKGMNIADSVALRDTGVGLRLKTARKVLDFVSGKSMVAKNNDENIPLNKKVRLLLVESTFKEASKSFTRIFTKIFFDQKQQQKEENDNQDSQYYSKLLKHAEVAVVNGEGRGALALEHLYPERKSSMMPFIVCVDTSRSSNQERFFSSAPSFFQLSNASKADQFMQVATKDDDRKLLLAEWLVNELPCFNKI